MDSHVVRDLMYNLLLISFFCIHINALKVIDAFLCPIEELPQYTLTFLSLFLNDAEGFPV